MPKIMAGYTGLSSFRDKTNGATILPIRAIIEAVPIPTLRTTATTNNIRINQCKKTHIISLEVNSKTDQVLPVGKSSPAYKYTVGKELLIPVKAIVANTTLIDGNAIIKSIQMPHTAFDTMSVHFRPNCFIASILINVPGSLGNWWKN